MITFNEFKESVGVVYAKNKSSVFRDSLAVTSVAFGILPYIVVIYSLFNISIEFIILLLFIVFCTSAILLFIYFLSDYIRKYVPYEIIKKEYWVNCGKGRNKVIKTPNIMLGKDFKSNMEFNIELKPSGKKKLERSRYTLIADKPATLELTLSSKINSKKLLPETKNLDRFFILNQLYEGNNNILSFIMEIEPAEIEEGYICFYLIDDCDFNLITDVFKPKKKFFLGKERIFPSKLTIDQKKF